MLDNNDTHVDVRKSAVLFVDDERMSCLTLGEAAVALLKLPPEQKARARIQSGGRMYNASEIERLRILAS
jgi:hypothetical protein